MILSESTSQESLNLQDPVLFNQIWKQHQSHLFYLAFRILDNRQEAEDVATESFVKLWNSKLSIPNEAAVGSWLRVTTRNASLNLAKQNTSRQKRLHELTHLFHDIETQWHEEDLLARLLDSIYRKIESLPEKSREVFRLRYIDNFSNEDIARQLGIRHQSVRDHLVRALKTLRLSLGKHSHLLGLLLILLRFRQQ